MVIECIYISKALPRAKSTLPTEQQTKHNIF